MKIHLRKRKQSNNGKINLFLEFYKGYEIRNGKTSALRNYKSLDLFIYEKPSNQIEKQHNKQTLHSHHGCIFEMILNVLNFVIEIYNAAGNKNKRHSFTAWLCCFALVSHVLRFW